MWHFRGIPYLFNIDVFSLKPFDMIFQCKVVPNIEDFSITPFDMIFQCTAVPNIDQFGITSF